MTFLKELTCGLFCGGIIALTMGVVPTLAQLPTCGNESVEYGEECDDGNLVDGDGCSSACKVEEDCFDLGNTFSFSHGAILILEEETTG